VVVGQQAYDMMCFLHTACVSWRKTQGKEEGSALAPPTHSSSIHAPIPFYREKTTMAPFGEVVTMLEHIPCVMVVGPQTDKCQTNLLPKHSSSCSFYSILSCIFIGKKGRGDRKEGRQRLTTKQQQGETFIGIVSNSIA